MLLHGQRVRVVTVVGEVLLGQVQKLHWDREDRMEDAVPVVSVLCDDGRYVLVDPDQVTCL